MDRIKATGDIFMGWSDRKWYLDGAAVQVSMIGFDRGEQLMRTLNGMATEKINANLTQGINLNQAHRLATNRRIAFQGPVVVGPFDIDPAAAIAMMRAGNPHGRPNSDVIFPVVNAADLTGTSRGWYMYEFR